MTPSRTTQVVTVLSARDELLSVMRVGMAIVIGVWMYLAWLGDAATATPGLRNLLPFQRMMADRTDQEQRTFRELQEALIEAEAVRAQTGAWPPPSELADAGVPPFAPDPTRRQHLTWTLSTEGAFVNYRGFPETPTAPAWLLLIQEPTPGVPPDQTTEDEEHHRLPDGTMLHVSTWVHEGGVAGAPHLVRMPQAEGWLQLYAVGPAAIQR